MDEKINEIRVKNIRLRVPTETYGYLECDIENPSNLSGLLALAEEFKKREIQTRLTCEHLYSEKVTGTSKTGKAWTKEVCLNPSCGAIRWLNGSKFGSWQHPIRS